MSGYSSSARQKIAMRIEKLTKQKALSEDQLLHLQFIFSRDDSVKILADRTRRLFRIDKYNDTTLDQVVKFLDVVENQATQKNTPIIVKTDAAPLNKRVQQAPPPVKKMLAPARAAAPPDEVLPPVNPPALSKSTYSAADIENDAIASAWLVEQTRRGKQAKKLDPALCCPLMLTTFTIDARQMLIKKKRKKTAKKRKSKIVEALEEEELDELDELDEHEGDEEVDVVPETITDDVVLYDGEMLENDDIELEDDQTNNSGDDDEDEVDNDEAEDIEENDDIEDEVQEQSAHSVVEDSEDDDSD